MVPRRDDAAANDEDVPGIPRRQLPDQLRHERVVTGRLGADPDDMDVIVDRVPGRFLRRLEQGTDIDVEPHVRERGGDHLGAAVVPVLPHLRHEHARSAPLLLLEPPDPFLDACEFAVPPVGPAVDAGKRLRFRPVAPEHLFHRH